MKVWMPLCGGGAPYERQNCSGVPPLSICYPALSLFPEIAMPPAYALTLLKDETIALPLLPVCRRPDVGAT